MDKWRYELAQIKKEFESGAFAQRTQSRILNGAPPQCVENNICNAEPQTDVSKILTMAFVNMQPIDSVYSVEDALKRGTLFTNIDKPLGEGRMR